MMTSCFPEWNQSLYAWSRGHRADVGTGRWAGTGRISCRHPFWLFLFNERQTPSSKTCTQPSSCSIIFCYFGILLPDIIHPTVYSIQYTVVGINSIHLTTTTKKYNMKFSTAAAMGVLVAAATCVDNIQAFAPTTTTTTTSLSSSAPHSLQITTKPSRPTSTQLGVFGLFKGAGSTKVAPTKAAKEVAAATAGDAPVLTDSQVQDLFYMWNDALKTLEPKMVAKRYAAQAILLPTVSDTPRTDEEGLVDYFTNFLKLEPEGTILQSQVYAGPGWCQDAGIYEFQMKATGATVKARYSFVYVYEDKQWKILHHHSSQMPEEVTPNSAPKLHDADQVRNLFYLWNDALDTLDPKAVESRYSDKAVLLPTVSDQPRTNSKAIEAYFVDFLKLQPQGTILESHVEMGANWAKDVGTYEFTLRGDSNRKVKARYTFVYTFEDGQWKISHHHSSMMPEEQAAQLEAATKKSGSRNNTPPLATPSEIQALFGKWNDALATLDSSKVAACYAKDAVLLPTVSDQPRTTPASIQAYFDDFLLKQPQGKILESHVEIGSGWAKDVGTYEFTMGTTGDKVQARYTYTYTQEDGEWKISHHHSSMMPEPLLAQIAECQAAAKVVETSKKQGFFKNLLKYNE